MISDAILSHNITYYVYSNLAERHQTVLTHINSPHINVIRASVSMCAAPRYSGLIAPLN